MGLNEPNLLVYGYVKPWWQETYLVPPGGGPEIPLATQLDRAAQLIRNIFVSHRLARETLRQKNPNDKVAANAFMLGLPSALQWLIDFVPTRTRAQKQGYPRSQLAPAHPGPQRT